MSGELQDVSVKNLSQYEIGDTDVRLTGPMLNFTLTWEKISGNLGYNVSGKVMDANLYGQGIIEYVFGIYNRY